MTAITGATGSINVNATSSGTVDLGSLTTLTARDVNMTVVNAGSTLDLSALASWSDATRVSELWLYGGSVFALR